MKKLLFFVLLTLCSCTSINSSKELEYYKEYYRATEALLDTLEDHDNWVDRFDPQDYYDAKSKLDSIN